MVSFTCNICGQLNEVERLGHEESSCGGCGSNVRLRALIYLLSVEMFGEGVLLPHFPALPAIRGLGFSDQLSYALPLAGKFDYLNTFYDREPRLDITGPHPDRHATYDFILSSDVFEHISPPVDRAFDETCRLLKPHGVLCMSVPFSLRDRTDEHYPSLHEFHITAVGGSPVLINRTREGKLEVRDDLVFHGGEGATLEMRLFSKADLEAKLLAAGFREVSFLTEPVPRFGIEYQGGWSLPLVARKDEFVFSRQAAGEFTRAYQGLFAQYQKAVEDLDRRARHIERLDSELEQRGEWARSLQTDMDEARAHLARLQSDFEQRTKWALDLNKELAAESAKSAALLERLKTASESRWLRFGNRLGLGPKL
jgi:SAM-dependent methyltransferase